MKFTMLELMVVIAIIGLLATLAIAWLSQGDVKNRFPRWRRRGCYHTGSIALANDPQSGIHMGGRLTKRTDGALARGLLVKAGSDANHVVVAGAADIPFLVTRDEGEVAEDLVNVQLLACADITVRLQTDGSGAIAYGDVLVPAAGGQVKKISAAGGNYYVVGIALEAPVTAAGEWLEVQPIGAWKTQ